MENKTKGKMNEKMSKMLPEDKIVYQGHVTLVKRPYEGRDYDVVVSRDAAIMLYIDEKDNVYFTEQFRPAMNEQHLSLPAETLDKPGLTPVEVMIEGLEEECGIKINKNQVLELGKIVSTSGHDTEKVYVFIAKGPGKKVGQRLQDEERIKVVKIPFEKAYQMVMNNEIESSKTSYLIMYEKLRRLGAVK